MDRERAAEIRYLYGSGGYTQSQLATAFGVSQTLVSLIVNNKVHRPTIRFGGRAKVRLEYE